MAFRQKLLRFKFFTAKPENDDFTTKIWISDNVLQRTNGNDRIGCLYCNSTAICMGYGDNIIDIRVVLEYAVFDLAHNVLRNPGDTLHAGHDGKDILRSNAAVLISVAFKAAAFEW